MTLGLRSGQGREGLWPHRVSTPGTLHALGLHKPHIRTVASHSHSCPPKRTLLSSSLDREVTCPRTHSSEMSDCRNLNPYDLSPEPALLAINLVLTTLQASCSVLNNIISSLRGRDDWPHLMDKESEALR